MFIFIDESGIHKITDFSTFVLVYIASKKYQSVQKRICKMEKSLNITYFHWSEAVWPIKEKFINLVLELDFYVKIVVVKNPVNAKIIIEEILTNEITEDVQKIVIDGKKPKWYERKIKKIIRDNKISIKKLKTVNKKSEAGVRLADLIAGLSRWYFDEKHKERIEKYFNKLMSKAKIINKTKTPLIRGQKVW